MIAVRCVGCSEDVNGERFFLMVMLVLIVYYCCIAASVDDMVGIESGNDVNCGGVSGCVARVDLGWYVNFSFV